MRFFDRLVHWMGKGGLAPKIKMGRYSDTYKRSENYAAWDRAMAFFEEGRYLDAYASFFDYLRDPLEDNVRYVRERDCLRFELYQGSRCVRGTADHQKVRAEAKIARTEALVIGLMRSLAEKNYSLKFSRFALDDDSNICIVFDTFTIDGSPYKLYHALKEIASNADKQDDLILDEFSRLQPILDAPVEELPLHEKEIKYRFIQNEILKARSQMEEGQVNKTNYPGAYAYVVLNLIYKLDYLTEPQGVMMETLERMHRIYFSDDGKSLTEKKRLLDKELDTLIARPKDLYFKEMYNVRYTFGITTPVNHDRIVRFIEAELPNMDWYLENGHDAVALAVPGYIAGYTLFYYAPPRPVKHLLQLLYAVMEPEYFNDLGYVFSFYASDKQKLRARAIKAAIRQVVAENKTDFPKLRASSGSLDFSTLPVFARSFMYMIRDLQGL